MATCLDMTSDDCVAIQIRAAVAFIRVGISLNRSIVCLIDIKAHTVRYFPQNVNLAIFVHVHKNHETMRSLSAFT